MSASAIAMVPDPSHTMSVHASPSVVKLPPSVHVYVTEPEWPSAQLKTKVESYAWSAALIAVELPSMSVSQSAQLTELPSHVIAVHASAVAKVAVSSQVNVTVSANPLEHV